MNQGKEQENLDFSKGVEQEKRDFDLKEIIEMLK